MLAELRNDGAYIGREHAIDLGLLQDKPADTAGRTAIREEVARAFLGDDVAIDDMIVPSVMSGIPLYANAETGTSGNRSSARRTSTLGFRRRRPR